MPISQKLLDHISSHQPQATSPATAKLLTILNQRYGRSLLAVLFYGSCQRRQDHFDGLLDLYLIVNSYKDTYPQKLLQIGNALLPPNVFYLETELDNRPVRAKYAVLSLKDLIKGTKYWCHPYLWGRFTQPATILYSRSADIKNSINQTLAQAVLTFVRATTPTLPPSFTARELWSTGLDLSYATELRPERPGQGDRLYLDTPDYYEQLLQIALNETHFSITTEVSDNQTIFHARIPAGYRKSSRRAWRSRTLIGKTFSVLRLLKAFFTFHGGINYICWKIERHSNISLSPAAGKTHNFFSLSKSLWQSWRQGAFH